jgi:hypothetical protein
MVVLRSATAWYEPYQRGLDVAVDSRALDVRLAADPGETLTYRLPNMDEASLEAELTGLLDDRADAAGRRGR